MSEYTGKETCPDCGNLGERIICPTVQFIGTKVQNPEFNQGLNCVVKSKRDRTEKAKRLGVQEVGNDYKSGEKMDQDFSEKLDTKLKKSWDNL